MAVHSSTFYFVNGQFISETEAKINISDLGVLRGYGVFDYVQVYNGKPFHLLDHLKRLKWSAEQIELELPMSIESMYDLTYELIKKNGAINAGIRFVVTGGISSKDQVLPIQGTSIFVLFHPFTPYDETIYSNGLRAVTTQILRMTPSVKSTNYIPAVLGMKKALRIGFNDAIYLNPSGELLEGTTSNLFFFKKNTWITCDSNEIVRGVTRSILLELMKGQYPIENRSLHRDELIDCEEAFLCSGVKDAVPLVQIDDQKIGCGHPGPQTAVIRKLYRDYIKKHLDTEQKKNQFLCSKHT
jgi:branched-chain amino acid aminotransferase